MLNLALLIKLWNQVNRINSLKETVYSYNSMLTHVESQYEILRLEYDTLHAKYNEVLFGVDIFEK